MNKNTPILIFGAGSIGERHIRNLWTLGYCNLLLYRQRNLPFRDIGEAEVQVFLDLNETKSLNPEVAFICTPTAQHLEQTIYCVENKMHVFVEKPLSHTLENMDHLKSIVANSNKLLQVGFMMRFHPHILKVKNYIQENIFGELISSTSHWGSYLPDWHPWENYKESYAAKKNLGGGVALTLCHDIDLAIWLAMRPIKNYETNFSYSGELDIETASIADIEINFVDGVNSRIHLNYLANPPIRKYHWEFEHVFIDFNYFDNLLIISSKNDPFENQEYKIEAFDRNQLFLAEVTDFFYKIENISNPVQHSFNSIRESELLISICNGDN